MADQYLQQLDRVTEAAGADLIPISDDPSGDARLKAITASDLIVSAAGGVPVVQDSAGDVTLSGDLGVTGSLSATGGDVTLCNPALQASMIRIAPMSSSLNGTFADIRSSGGHRLYRWAYLSGHGRSVQQSDATVFSDGLPAGKVDAWIIGTSLSPTTGIPASRYLDYDTLNVEIGVGVPLVHRRETSTQIREVSRSTPEWIVSTDASRTGRVIHTVSDWAGSRETFREEADGSGPRIGFLGADAVARPTVTGSWSDGTAAQSLAAALASLGLITDETAE